MALTRDLGRFVADLSFEWLPQDAAEVARIGFIDCIATMIAGAYETVIAACRRHDKWPGMGGVDAEELMQKYIGMGMRLVLAGSDGGFLMAAASRRAVLAREWGAGATKSGG